MADVNGRGREYEPGRVGRTGARSGPGLLCQRFYGSCCARVAFGVVLPAFTNTRSRSLPLPVYFTWPFMFTSRVL